MSRLLILAITALLFALSHVPGAHAQPDRSRPLIVIPGILGSKICARAHGEVIWGNRWSLSNLPDLALPVLYDPKSLPHVACGLIEVVNVLGPFQIHQYDDLLKTLRDMGYEPDRTLFVFAYDWRLSNRDTAQQFNEFVRQKVPTGQMDIVAHSMGGIIAKLWMAEHAGAKRVKMLVTLGTPYLGSASTFKTLDDGWGFWGNLLARGLGNIRETALTWPSLYELLPSYERCCYFRSATPNKLAYFDPFASARWTKFRWLPTSFRVKDRQEWLERTLSAAKAIAKVEVPQGPMLVPIVSSLIPTAWRVEFDPGDGHVVQYLPQPGDGTVYEYSAANNQPKNARAATTPHQTIFANDASRQVLRWVLTDGPEPTSGLSSIRASLRTATGALVSISAASAEIAPPVLELEQDAQFIVELTGSQDLASADLSNVKAFREGVSTSLPQPRQELKSASADGTVVRLIFPLKAPQEAGAFSATVNLPGVADLPDVALVVPK